MLGLVTLLKKFRDETDSDDVQVPEWLRELCTDVQKTFPNFPASSCSAFMLGVWFLSTYPEVAAGHMKEGPQNPRYDDLSKLGD